MAQATELESRSQLQLAEERAEGSLRARPGRSRKSSAAARRSGEGEELAARAPRAAARERAREASQAAASSACALTPWRRRARRPAGRRPAEGPCREEERLAAALAPSLMACLASSPGNVRRTAA